MDNGSCTAGALHQTGYTYRKILRMDLERDRCDILKSDPGGWQPGEESLTAQLEQFAASGAVHPEDRDRFVAFTRLESLRTVLLSWEKALSLLYRRRTGDSYRWNLMEVIADPTREAAAVICVKDIQEVVREGLEREETSSLQALEDRSYIISSLATLFFSTYYIDLEQNTFRTVTQLRRVGDVLGSEVNYTAGIQIYASHFVHPEDREEYLRMMSVRNLQETLRWWQPCAAVEYRRLPEEGGADTGRCSWIRATAVLARADGEGTPKTAVYVAQDITDSRRALPE